MTTLAAEGAEQPLYLDACATSPPAPEVGQAMAEAAATAWANPSSLHGFGLAAAERLERSRQEIAAALDGEAAGLTFCSGGTEAAHLALRGIAATLAPGRLVISAVEHPAVAAAAARLEAQGWDVVVLPVDPLGRICLEELERWLEPPTRLVSVIWGQSEVGTLQPIEAIGHRCRSAGILFHTDAVQVVGHRPIRFGKLPVDLLSFTAHKLQGPRGIGVLLRRPELDLDPLLDGGGQEAGLRAGTEPVPLAAGLARALLLAEQRLCASAGRDPLEPLRDGLRDALLQLPGLTLSGCPRQRLPHHLSLLVSDGAGRPLPGRRLVQALWREGLAVSSGTACRAGQAGGSPVLRAMGYDEAHASSGVRLSLGPWLTAAQLERVPAAFERACAAVSREGLG
jgi:cysteine desulfurase